MLTRLATGCLALGGALLALGMLSGNYVLALSGAFPLLACLAGLGAQGPGGVEVQRSVEPVRVPSGGVVEVRLRVRAAKGQGLLEVHCPVPDEFVLEEGSNLHLLAKGRAPLDAEVTFKVRCTKRGTWDLAPVQVDALDQGGFAAARRSQHKDEASVEVKPALEDLRRVRDMPGYARTPLPHGDLAVTGTRTTDFKELRAYAPGDPPRAINWKATARRQAALPPRAQRNHHQAPLVNEYEHEGRKTVWLFVDAGTHMEVGSTLDNAFEHGLRASASVSRFYLERGYRLGMYVYNARGQTQLLVPNTGSGQILKVHQTLMRLRTGAPSEGLRDAVERCRGFLHQGRPLVVVVTRASQDTDRLVEGVRRVRSLTGRRRRKLPVMVITPQVPTAKGEGPQEDAAVVVRRLDRHAIARVRALGAAAVEWDPAKHPLATAMLWGVR